MKTLRDLIYAEDKGGIGTRFTFDDTSITYIINTDVYNWSGDKFHLEKVVFKTNSIPINTVAHLIKDEDGSKLLVPFEVADFYILEYPTKAIKVLYGKKY